MTQAAAFEPDFGWIKKLIASATTDDVKGAESMGDAGSSAGSGAGGSDNISGNIYHALYNSGGSLFSKWNPYDNLSADWGGDAKSNGDAASGTNGTQDINSSWKAVKVSRNGKRAISKLVGNGVSGNIAGVESKAAAAGATAVKSVSACPMCRKYEHAFSKYPNLLDRIRSLAAGQSLRWPSCDKNYPHNCLYYCNRCAASHDSTCPCVHGRLKGESRFSGGGGGNPSERSDRRICVFGLLKCCLDPNCHFLHFDEKIEFTHDQYHHLLVIYYNEMEKEHRFKMMVKDN